jgi:transposase-like protein
MMKRTMTSTKGLSSAAPERKEGERSEPDWSEGAAAPSAKGPHEGLPPSVNLAQAPGSEVVERPVRRRFTAEYKRAILKETDRCSAGEIGALLRREGLYSSHLTSWRRQRESGELEALLPKKRGRKGKPVSPLAKENERQKRQIEALGRRLAHAELIIEVQKKIAGLLGIPLNPPENGGNA